LFFWHFVKQVVGVLLAMVRWLQLGVGQATGSNPAGIELGTKAGFRDKSKVAAWSTVSSCTGEEGLRRAVLTMASVKARSTGPKSGAPSTWHPPQHGVGAARLRLAGLQHEAGGSSTTEWWTRRVTGDIAHSLTRLQLPCGSERDSARPAAKGCSAHRAAALVSPLLSLPLLLLLFSGSWWWRRIRIGDQGDRLGTGICRAAGLGFRLQRDGGDRFRAAWHASAGAGAVGAAAMGGAACVAPSCPTMPSRVD
jgi:hypothetical protein